MSKKGLTHISDRTNQWRYVDKDGFEQWLQPVSAYKASEDILYGQAVSVVTISDEASDDTDPESYVRKTDTARDVKTIGLALETVSAGETVHVLPFGMFTYDKTYKGLDGIDEYDPGFTYESVGKKVYVKNNEPGNLTVSEDEILQDYKHIICVGYLTDAPVNGSSQNLTTIEISISGDERGPVDHTQFEAVLGEDVVINENDPIRFFAIGCEKDEKFKFKMVLTPQNHTYTNHDFIAIQKYDGKTYFLYPGDSLDLEGLEDNSDAAFVKMSKIYNNNFVSEHINLSDEYVSSAVDGNIQVLTEALTRAFNAVSSSNGQDSNFNPNALTDEAPSGLWVEAPLDPNDTNTGLGATINSNYDINNPLGWLEFTANEPGGYYTLYISSGLYKSFEETTIYNHGSYNNQGTVVLADARIGTRRNIIGAYVGKNFGLLEKGTKTLFMRVGEYTLDPTSLSDNALYKSTATNNIEGTVFYLGNNGQITNHPYSQIDFVNRVATLKTANKLIVDVGPATKYYSGSFPVGYMKPCINVSGRKYAEYGFILMDGVSEYPCTAGSLYYQLYQRLLGQFSEEELHSSREGYFTIPLVTRQGQPMQIKYMSEGIYEDLTRTAFVRKIGRFEQELENTDIPTTLPKIDITALIDFGITDSGYEKPDIDNLDIHLYIDPNKEYTSGPHDWREVPVGFFNFNNYGTYGFSWSIEEDLQTIDNHTPYGRYYVYANVGEGRGIAYVDGNNQAPMKLEGCYFKVYVARKEFYPRQFDLDGVFGAYISNTVYDVNGQPDTTKAVSGKAVLDAIASKVDLDSITTTEGAIVRLGNKDQNIVSSVIELIARQDMPIISKEGTITIGNDETKQCLVVRDGKVYKTGVTGVDRVFETTTRTLPDNSVETIYKLDSQEVATISHVRQHGELTIDGNDYKSYANEDVKNGKIHGMKFGYNGNIDASTVCSIRLMLNSNAVFNPDDYNNNNNNIDDAYIPIRYLNTRNEYESYSEGTVIYTNNGVELGRSSITQNNNTYNDIIRSLSVNPDRNRYVEVLTNNASGSKRFETTYVFDDGLDENDENYTAGHIFFFTGNRNSNSPSYAVLHAGKFIESSWSKAKKIFGERILDNDLITTALAEGSIQYDEANNPYKDLKSKLGSALQAAYELPLAYWLGNNEKSWYNKSLGIVVERVRDVANNITTENERSIYSSENSNNSHLAYNYTEEEIESIKTYYDTLTDNYGQDVSSTVGLLLSAAKETQERLLKTEASIFGADYESIPGDKKPNINIDINGVTQEPTTFGLNRLIRAICAELYNTTNPESGNLELTLDKEGNSITSLSRIDEIERTIRGARNNDNDPTDFNVTSDNTLDTTISSTYPYEPDISGEHTEGGINVRTREKLGEVDLVNEERENKFNGTIDAIHRITKKLNALTEEVNGEDNINVGPARLVGIEDLIAELIKEIYLYENEDRRHNVIPEDGVSRFDSLTEKLYRYTLVPRADYSDELTADDSGFAEDISIRLGKSLAFDKNGNNAIGKIPTTLDEYDNYINIIDIIIDALGDPSDWYRKTAIDSGDLKSLRYNNPITTRLFNIENSLDNIAGLVKDNSDRFEVFSGQRIGNILSPNSITGESQTIDGLLSRLAYYLGGSETRLILNQEETTPVSFNDAVSLGTNVAAGLRNLSTRLDNLEKYQALIKYTIGGSTGNKVLYENGFTVGSDMEEEDFQGYWDDESGSYSYSSDIFTTSNQLNLIWKDMEALKKTVWGQNTYFHLLDDEDNFKINNNVYQIIKELSTPISNYGNEVNYYKFNSGLSHTNILGDNFSLTNLPESFQNISDTNRLSVIEKEILHIREFLGIERFNIEDNLRYKYLLNPLVEQIEDEEGLYAGSQYQTTFEGYPNSIFPNGELNENIQVGDNQIGEFENDSILNEILFNTNSIRLLRGNVGSNSALLRNELVLDRYTYTEVVEDGEINIIEEEKDSYTNPQHTQYEKDHFDNWETSLNSFENAFLRKIKVVRSQEGQGTSTITQRINNISDYLIGMSGYLTDRIDYLEGLDYIGKSSGLETIDAKIKLGNDEYVFYTTQQGNKLSFLVNGESSTPIETSELVSKLNMFRTDVISGTNTSNYQLSTSATIYYSKNGTYYRAGNTNSTNNPGNLHVLKVEYRNIDQDKVIQFNGKYYNIDSSNTYKNLLTEVRVHNELLKDIVSYIDETPGTAAANQPTTGTLI